jgi:thiol-disulfide isomerase/thioredoxin
MDPRHNNMQGRARAGLAAMAMAIALALAGLGWPAPAQAGEALGQDRAGKTHDLDGLRGRAVVLFYWSTDCPVCLDKWPELRANARGWLGKPFTLVAVNVDADEQNWRDHEQIAGLMQSNPANVISLRGTGATRPSHLPFTRLIDVRGATVSRVEGRVPPSLWDDVADLMP